MDPIGHHHFWGFSPALDLQQTGRTAFGAAWASPAPATPAGEAPAASEAAPSQRTTLPAMPLAPEAEAEPLRFLLVQPGDPRHIIKTVAQRYRHSGRPLHFYVYERQVEVVARHLLLLTILCDWEVPIRQRAVTWLEVYGNAMLQARTSKYLSDRVRPLLIDLLCNGRGAAPLGSVVDFSALRFKARDELEEVFKGYHEGQPFDMALLRDTRLRAHYKERYDFRTNLIDWDYQMGVRPHAGGVHYTQYREWRQTGVAFEYGLEQRHEAPNRSLASYAAAMERGRGSTLRRGYWGDIVVSPFHALGTAAYVPTDDEAAAAAAANAAAPAAAPPAGNYAHQLFEVLSRLSGSEQWRHHAVEIATYNVVAWMCELETQRAYVMRAPHDIYSGLAEASGAVGAASAGAAEPKPEAGAAGAAGGEGAGDAPATRMTPEEVAAATAAARAAAVARAKCIARAWSGVKVTYMTGDFEAEYLARGRLPAGAFHHIHLSARAAHLLAKPELLALLHTVAGGVVSVETARNIPTMRQEQVLEFTRRVLHMGGQGGLALLGSNRQLSADTCSIGTVLEARGAGAGAGAGASSKHFTFSSRAPFLTDVTATGPDAFLDVVPGGGEAPGGGAKARRSKDVSMAWYSHNPSAHPAVRALVSEFPRVGVDASAGGTSAGLDDLGSAARAAASATAAACVAVIRGLEAHDPQQGDNPPPEVVFFGHWPGAAAAGDAGAALDAPTACARAYAALAGGDKGSASAAP